MYLYDYYAFVRTHKRRYTALSLVKIRLYPFRPSAAAAVLNFESLLKIKRRHAREPILLLLGGKRSGGVVCGY